MSISSTGWFLHVAAPDAGGQPGTLVLEDFELQAIAADEILAEPVYGCWEGNIEHAISRRPIDVCRLRGEPRVILGNAGVVRVAAVGTAVRGLTPGQHAIVFASSVVDRFGYPERMLAYDAAGTMGCLATRIKLKEREAVPLPEPTRHSLAQWAAFSVRSITAWSNWELAYGTLRLLVGHDDLPAPHVWGWSGGTTLAQLQLAQRQSCRAVMISGTDAHLEEIRRAGITAIDRRRFGNILFDEQRYAEDAEFRRAYAEAERAFLREVSERTDGENVHIFIDYIGSSVFRATCKALAREAIVTTAGWKDGMTLAYLRSVECIGRHQFIHTHYAKYSQAVAAVAYAEQYGWMPSVGARIYGFEEIPELVAEYRGGQASFYPVYSVNGE